MSSTGDRGGRPAVGFVGLGRMGLPMATNLLAAGAQLRVFNRTSDRCRPLVEAGALQASSPAEIGAACEIVVTMVADAEAAREVIVGDDGILAGARPGLVVAEMSTIGPAAARELAGVAAERGVALLDAPVSGSVATAEAAELTTVVGGDRDAFERARPTLAAMTRDQLYLGASGAGAAMKLALNVLVASAAHSIAEALVLAESAGVASEDAYAAIAASAVSSPFVRYKRGAYLDPAGAPASFSLRLMRKDLALAAALAAESDLPLHAAAAADEAMARAEELVGGEADIAAVAAAARQAANPGRSGADG
ncbi:MAG TPA: NAD(P)-dependent oxidoreductase [Solirubrobacterales bacterium]|nr:NAD(P)-dependent oxidoreductase [Solirubrobacterales bacterium]